MIDAGETTAAAAAWVARMDADGWSAGDEAALQEWLAGDRRNAGALLRAQAAWMTFDPALAAAPPATAGRPPRRGVLRIAGALVAASLLAVLAWSDGPLRYATGVGEIRRVPLADGSVAAINTASELVVSLGQRTRAVELASGEAWFQVAKDKTRPFVVAAGEVRVRAVGTAFSVRRQVDGAVILVSEGVVEAWLAGAEDHRMRVAAGGRLSFADASRGGGASVDLRAEPPSAIDRALAWRSGKIDLDGVSLGTAVSQFNRYSTRRLVIDDPEIADEQLDGVFRVDDPAGFAAAAGVALGVPVDLSRPDAILIGRRR